MILKKVLLACVLLLAAQYGLFAQATKMNDDPDGDFKLAKELYQKGDFSLAYPLFKQLKEKAK